MDSLDREIVKELENDSRRSSFELAQKLNISPPTIRRRINRLIKNEEIHFTVLINPASTGLNLMTIVGLSIRSGRMEPLLEKLYKKTEIIMVAKTTGRFDLLLLCWFRDNSHLSQFLQTEFTDLDEIIRTETFVCLQTSVRSAFSSQVMGSF